jgi:hypothetical protein
VPVPPDALVPVAPVPALVPVPVWEPGRPLGVLSIIVPLPAPARLREALSVIVPAAPVPDIEPDDLMAESARVPAAPAVPAAPLVPVADGVPTSPALAAAVLSRLLPLLHAPAASTAASASMLLPVTFRMIGISSSALSDRSAVRQKESQRGVRQCCC